METKRPDRARQGRGDNTVHPDLEENFVTPSSEPHRGDGEVGGSSPSGAPEREEGSDTSSVAQDDGCCLLGRVCKIICIVWVAVLLFGAIVFVGGQIVSAFRPSCGGCGSVTGCKVACRRRFGQGYNGHCSQDTCFCDENETRTVGCEFLKEPLRKNCGSCKGLKECQAKCLSVEKGYDTFFSRCIDGFCSCDVFDQDVVQC
uniref:Uncharacterized protein n=1 Tax=Chromera velia CCMP2878 TaxID=1169474 RepID=A0A0G4G8Y9_9ALVE|eukprot:Cvel_20732.t1-p1 / transcript=Cvel_20732.t1 / gene=Cvel_20732 / organism=Chromera_velia_CCMP2878 / gene_product=hypothetical protein / transcript_product=hypothetical protein / location=Cvel_scaffold1887:37057-38019(+) / protein_length=201 / sequence_SO=supercontig / SO=protein_coding / is_pseudo=false